MTNDKYGLRDPDYGQARIRFLLRYAGGLIHGNFDCCRSENFKAAGNKNNLVISRSGLICDMPEHNIKCADIPPYRIYLFGKNVDK